ncbi:MAG: hypothetical protein IT361_07090 [Gemmatimonadaceae bacterium]|nr:hypothetical protein [Gemmatimonadaceae bacterium]
MIGRRVTRETLDTAPLDGMVLAADVRDGHGRVVRGKGDVLSHADRDVLASATWQELHLVVLETNDVHERAAGERLARAVAGSGVVVGAFSGGQWPIRATSRGVLQVNVDSLCSVNESAELSVYTLFDGQVVEAGETVARAKIIPFAIPEAVIASGESRAAASGPVVAVRAFQPRRVAALVQESLGARATERFRAVFGEKVRWFGGVMSDPVFVAPEVDVVRGAMDALLAARPDLLVVAGSRTMDPLDPVFDALVASGARLLRRGLPAHPGSLCWVAQRGDTTIIGMPSCGVFSQATIFDLLLTWVFAGVPLDAGLLARIGHGGFLTKDMAFRFPPYRLAGDRGEVE